MTESRKGIVVELTFQEQEHGREKTTYAWKSVDGVSILKSTFAARMDPLLGKTY